jgi:hypothetical protein
MGNVIGERRINSSSGSSSFFNGCSGKKKN